jgi:hypothetical protein
MLKKECPHVSIDDFIGKVTKGFGKDTKGVDSYPMDIGPILTIDVGHQKHAIEEYFGYLELLGEKPAMLLECPAPDNSSYNIRLPLPELQLDVLEGKKPKSGAAPAHPHAADAPNGPLLAAKGHAPHSQGPVHGRPY